VNRSTIFLVAVGIGLLSSVGELAAATQIEAQYGDEGEQQNSLLAFDLKEFLDKTTRQLQEKLDSGRKKEVAEPENKEENTRREPVDARQNSPSAGARKMTRDEIREIQQRLAVLGLTPGIDDGLMGKKTTRAISQYQKISGFPINGAPSQAILASLREKTPGVRYRPPVAVAAEPELSSRVPRVMPMSEVETQPAPVPTTEVLADEAVDLDDF